VLTVEVVPVVLPVVLPPGVLRRFNQTAQRLLPVGVGRIVVWSFHDAPATRTGRCWLVVALV
jgi:hypothetical protein